MSDKNQRLVLSILDFLSTSMEDGTVKADDKEGLEIAVQCIGEAFGVNPSDATQRERLSIKPATLPTIFDVYVKTRDKIGAGASSSSASTTTATPPPPPAAKATAATLEDKQAAEALKASGNAKMSARAYAEAIAEYTKAIELDGRNPVYFSNRAAAYSSIENHDGAIADAEKAIELDPNFFKAYSRLGHAHYCKEDYPSAVEAFEQGLLIDPNNANLKSGLENAKARVPTVSRSPAANAGGAGGMPDLSALAGMFGGGAGGGGGMPDIASMMNNPALMSMAQNMMQNGGLEQMMQNPMLRNMAENFQNGGAGGGMPDLSALMSDPNIMNLASQFMGGQGRGGGAAP